MSGSGGGGGYEYQARATAYVAAHILAQEPLSWLEHSAPDVPIAVAEETNGFGDDLNITLQDGTVVELQAKHGLKKDNEFWEAIVKLAHGLTKEPLLYGILLTDSTASGTIKDKLRQDLKRLGQGRTDDLKEITREVIDKFDKEGISHDSELFRRLRVIVIDLDDESQGTKPAKILLSQAIENQHQAGQAWKTLVTDGLNLIKLRGRRDADALARLLLSESIQLSATSSNPAIIAERYRAWLKEKTVHLKVPGLPLYEELSIETNWIPLRAKLREDSNESFDAEFVAELYHLSVVTGTPGTGKSTLMNRLAHRLSASGKRVLLVQLPEVQKLWRKQGERFEDAIIKASADNSGLNEEELRLALSAPDYLLADGLDECNSDRANIAKELDSWVKAPSRRFITRVIVTTRIGYEPGLLPGWKHTEICPLDRSSIQKYAKQFLNAYPGEEAEVEKRLALLENQLQTNKNASLAARNPLLLGFLVQLIAEGESITQKRAQLYEDIIELAYARPLQDREPIELEQPIIAQRTLEIAGWKLLHEPELSARELLQCLSRKLTVELRYLTSLEAQIKAEESLIFWENRRILERRSVGNQDVLTFIHPTLCEYAAARYAYHLNDAKLHEWLEEVRANPRWREPILLAAGLGAGETIVRHLLELDKSEEPASKEVLLAVEVLAELDNPPPQLLRLAANHIKPRLELAVNHIKPRLESTNPSVFYEATEAVCELLNLDSIGKIGILAESNNRLSELLELAVNQIKPRLESANPFVVCETTKAALKLANWVPKVIGSIAQSLQHNVQPWTCLSAIRIAIACSDSYIDLDTLAERVDEIITKVTESERISKVIVTLPSNIKCIEANSLLEERDIVIEEDWHGQWNLWNQVVIKGVKLLMRKRPGFETDRRIKQVMKEGLFTFMTRSFMEIYLGEYVFENLEGDQKEHAKRLLQLVLDRLYERAKTFYDPSWPDFRELKRDRDANQAILNAIIRVSDNTTSGEIQQKQQSQEPVSLAILLRGMRWPKVPSCDWSLISVQFDSDALDAVFKGAIAAMEIGTQTLVTQAKFALEYIQQYDLDAIESALRTETNSTKREWALQQIREIHNSPFVWSISSNQIPKVPVEPRWELAQKVDIHLKDLVHALKHPSPGISLNATLLLMHGVGGSEAAYLVR
jgi:hypothetical protein